MRIAFISDIHSNIDALNAILSEIQNEQADETYRLEADKPNEKRFKRGFAEIFVSYGVPSNPDELLEDGYDLTRFHKLIDIESADIYVYGHVEKPYIKRVRKKIFVNCGYFVEPGFAHYALMDIDDNSVAIQIVNIPYTSNMGSSGKGNNKFASLI